MTLGIIIGKTSTTEFKFKVDKEAKKYQYIKIPLNDSFVFAQIIELETSNEETIAQCLILGFKEEEKLRPLRIPLAPGAKVEEADDDFINKALGLEKEKGAFLGTLDYTNLKVHIDLNKLLTKHIAILARSGSGKSYCAGVLIEEILDRNIPLVIIDPHAEYPTLKFSNKKEEEKLKKFDLKPKDYLKNIQEYTPDISINSEAQQLKLSVNNISPSSLMHLLPAKLSNMQTGLLYSSLQNIDKINFDDLIISLDTEETNAKYTLINLVEQIKKLNIFSEIPTSLQELVQPGKASIINLKGISPEISEIVVYKLVNDLFEARKLGNIPPFFLVLEEAQNFAPERSFGEAKSSQIIRRVASVDYSEFILVRKNNNICFLKIGEFIDSLMKCEGIQKDKDGFETLAIKSNFYTPAFDKNLKIKYKKIKKIIRHKIHEPLYELNLEKGKKVKVTSSHSVFIFKNNKIQDIAVSSLKIGDYALVPINIPKGYKNLKYISFKNDQKLRLFKLPSKIPLTNDFLILLGYYVAEGSCNTRSIRFTLNKSEKEYRNEIIECMKRLFDINPQLYFSKTSLGIDIIYHKTSLSELFSNLCGKNALKRKVPYFIFNLSNELKFSFLRGCFNGDGYLRTRKGNKGGNSIEISYKTISKDLIEALSYLLLSINIPSAIYKISSKRKNHKEVYQLVVNGKDCEFLLNILKNNKHNAKLKESLKIKNRNTNSLEYKIPTEPFKLAYKSYKPIASDNSINERMCIRRKRSNRKDLLKFIDYLKKKSRIKPDKEVINFLSKLCTSDIGFLKIKKIKKIKSSSDYVYDLSIGESENFISGTGGIILHNSEGRKFGMGMCLVSQRPSRLDKSALSQCTTQIILKVTNPSDLKSITSSVEGLTAEADREIKTLPIGTALLIGVVSQPLFVNIRPRKSKHGGEAVDIVGEKEDDVEEASPDLLSVIKQTASLKDIELSSQRKIKSKETFLIPCLFLQLQRDSNSYNILINLYENKIIKNPDTLESIPIENFKFSDNQLKIVKLAVNMKSFTPAELFNLSKMQFSEVYDVIRNLTQKGFFVKDNNSFVLNKQFSYLFEINKFNIYKKPEYLKIKYDKILEAKYKKENILDLFSKFFNIVNSKECYLEYFRIGYEEAKEKN